MSALHFKSASELARAIRQKEIGSAELLDHFIARHESHNPKVNAIVDTDFDAARKRARAADAALAKGEVWGPLHGLPMTIKDALEVAGFKATGGSPELAEHRPQRHADAVQNIVDAGAVIFGKTNVPLFSGDLQSYNDVYGTTNNPWDLARTPGGSSGGSASALAAGLTGLELGSDIGGSIRTPAHFCGVYGHKPSFGIVSKRGHIPPPPGAVAEVDLSVVGPLARSAEDLELLLDIVARPNPAQAAAWKLDLPPPRATRLQDLRVGIWLDDPYCAVDADSVELMTRAAKALEEAGAQVHWERRPDFSLEETTEVYLTLLHSVVAARMPDSVKQRWAELVEVLSADDRSHQALQARGGTISHADWLLWDEARQQLRAKWAAFFEHHDILLCPAALTPAFEHDHESDFHKRRLTVNGKERDYLDMVVWSGLPLVSYLPSTVTPVGLTQAGLPVGMQIVAPFLEDRTSLEVAKLMTPITGGFRAPPGF